MHGAIGIVGIAPGSQEQTGLISLIHPLHVLGQTRGLTDTEDQYTRGQRVQSAGVADACAAWKTALHTVDHVTRSDSRRLIEHEQTMVGGQSHSQLRPS